MRRKTVDIATGKPQHIVFSSFRTAAMADNAHPAPGPAWGDAPLRCKHRFGLDARGKERVASGLQNFRPAPRPPAVRD